MAVGGSPATGGLRSRGCCDQRLQSHSRPRGWVAGLRVLSASIKRAAVIRSLLGRYDQDTANQRKQRALVDFGVITKKRIISAHFLPLRLVK